MRDDWGGFYDHELPPQIGQDQNGYDIRVPGIVISPYAKHCAVDSQPMSFDALNRFIEDDFLGGSRLDPTTDGRPDPRGTAQPVPRETAVAGDLTQDFDFSRTTFPVPAPFPTPPTYAWCTS